MQEVLLVIQLIVAIAMVAVILLQRSDGGALGIGGGPGGMVSARGAANLLTRATTILAIAFIGISLVLSILASRSVEDASVLDQLEEAAPVIEEPVDDLAPPTDG